jgi:hypothetical protein
MAFFAGVFSILYFFVAIVPGCFKKSKKTKQLKVEIADELKSAQASLIERDESMDLLKPMLKQGGGDSSSSRIFDATMAAS